MIYLIESTRAIDRELEVIEVCVCVFTPGPGLGLGAHGIPSVTSTFADHIWFARGSASVGRAYKGEGEQSPVSNNAQKRQMKSLTWNICKGCVAS